MKSKITLLAFILIAQPCFAKVMLGIDVLEKNKFDLLAGKKIGLITNQTGVDGEGKTTIDVLHHAPNVRLVKLFAPEHGIRGKAEHGKSIYDGVDEKTGLPVISLYGKTQRLTPEMIKGLYAIVFDIQDIGTRFYTYTTTLAYALEEAEKAGIEFIVLDRPNPITGAIVEGDILVPSIKHFTAYLQVPTRHGMTVGEIANWYCKTAGLKVKLRVVKLQGWRRPMWWDETGLKFVPPSPNIRNIAAASLYPGIGCFEATNVSVGRGTGEPFEVFGAPWIENKLLLEKLNFVSTPGFEFKTVSFKPKDDLYKNEKCYGIKIEIKDRAAARPMDLFVQIFKILWDLYPEEFVVRWDEMARMMGSTHFQTVIERGESAETILVQLHDEAKKFEESRKPYLLYKADKNSDDFR